MSTKYKHGDHVPTEVLAKRLDELADVVGRPGEERDRELTRRIPAELDRDADLVLSEAATRLTALAALCQEGAAVLERTANDTLDGRNMAVRLREANTSSLARLKAQWQAEALEVFAIHWRHQAHIAAEAGHIMQADAVCDVADDANERAAELRRQFEEE